MEVRSVPRVQPVGDDVDRFAPGFVADDRVERIFRPGREGRSLGRRLRRYGPRPNEVSVVDEATLKHLQFQGWVDVDNAYVWLIVVLLIEIELWLQNRDRFSSPVMGAVRQAKSFFYLLLIVNIFIWFYQDYPRYAWDAFLWIFGFWAIELNLAEWEMERVEQLKEEPS